MHLASRAARFSDDEFAVLVPRSDWTQRPVVSSRPVGSTPPNQGRRPARSGVEHRPKAVPAGPDRCRRTIGAPLRDDPAGRRRTRARRRFHGRSRRAHRASGRELTPPPTQPAPDGDSHQVTVSARRGSPFHPPLDPGAVWWSARESRAVPGDRSMGNVGARSVLRQTAARRCGWHAPACQIRTTRTLHPGPGRWVVIWSPCAH